MCLYASHSRRSVHPSAKNDENRSLSCYRTLIFTARLSAAADSSLVADQSVLVHVWWCGISRLSLARTVIYKSNQSNQNHPSLEATTVCSVCRHSHRSVLWRDLPRSGVDACAFNKDSRARGTRLPFKYTKVIIHRGMFWKIRLVTISGQNCCLIRGHRSVCVRRRSCGTTWIFIQATREEPCVGRAVCAMRWLMLSALSVLITFYKRM